MKMQLRLTLAVVIVAGACSGCLVIPARYTARPGAAGIVIDAQNMAPVHDAVVTVASSPNGRHLAGAVTGADGGFSIRPLRKWGLFVWPGDPFSEHFRLTVERPGYRTASQIFWHSGLNRYVTNFADFALEPVSP